MRMEMEHPAVVGDLPDATRQEEQLVRERGRRIKAAAELGLARSSRGRQWGRALGRRPLVALPKDAAGAAPAARHQPTKKVTMPLETALGDDDFKEYNDDDEEVVVEEKVALLRQLVPGGEDMDEVEGLLEETADYIAALKQQVGVMRALACVLSGACLDGLPEKKSDHKHGATPEK